MSPADQIKPVVAYRDVAMTPPFLLKSGLYSVNGHMEDGRLPLVVLAWKIFQVEQLLGILGVIRGIGKSNKDHGGMYKEINLGMPSHNSLMCLHPALLQIKDEQHTSQ